MFPVATRWRRVRVLVVELKEGKVMDKPRVAMPAKEARTDARTTTVPMATFRPAHEAIARRAYELYEGSGRPDGRDVEFWLKAEHELITER